MLYITLYVITDKHENFQMPLIIRVLNNYTRVITLCAQSWRFL